MSDGAKLLSAIQKAFLRIGTSNGHAFPEHLLDFGDTNNAEIEHKVNQERASYEFMVAGELRSLADKRYKVAKETADELGITEGIENVKAGQSGVLYQGQITSVTVKVNNPTTRVDNKKLVTELRKAGVDAAVIDKALKAATVESSPAKRITAAPVL